MSTTLLVDGHVHYHSCFGVAGFLRAAQVNFRAAAAHMGGPSWLGCLMFSESSWSQAFSELAGGLIERDAPEWALEWTDEDCSFYVRRGEEARLLLVAGRQIVTAERLEVLALATAREFEDGLPFRDAVTMATSSEAVPIIPWGFGKWTGRRGALVRDLLSSPEADRIYLGDNGGRPRLTPTPSLFGFGRARGVPVLPGSDPLPIPGEVRKPGRYGFVLKGQVDPRAPAASVRAMIAARTQPRRFGRLERLPTFVLRQTQLRLRRRGPARRGAVEITEAGRS